MKEYILRILVSFVLANFAASCISPASNYKLKTIKQTVESAVIHDMFWNEFHGLGAPNDRGADCLFALIRGLRSDGSVLKYKCYRINDSQDIYVKILESKTSYTLSRYDNEWMFHKNIKIKNDNSLLEIGRFYAPVNSDSVCRFLNNVAGRFKMYHPWSLQSVPPRGLSSTGSRGCQPGVVHSPRPD